MQHLGPHLRAGVTLARAQIDVIISEWMGYFLLREVTPYLYP